MSKHVRETTTSTDLLIRDGDDHPEGQFLVDCSCGQEYYVKPIKELTEFESLEAGQREHVMQMECPPLYSLTIMARSLGNYDPAKAAQNPLGWPDIKQYAVTLHGEIAKILAQVETMQTEHEQAIED